jgi:hypothetical protein
MVADAFGARPVCFEIDVIRRQLAQAALSGSLILDPSDSDVSSTLEEAVAPHGLTLSLMRLEELLPWTLLWALLMTMAVWCSWRCTPKRLDHCYQATFT